jgi:hypothetical protein
LCRGTGTKIFIYEYKLTFSKAKNLGVTYISLNPPLWKKNSGYSIRFHGLERLKLLGSVMYSIGRLIGLRDYDISLLFVGSKKEGF